MSVVCGVSARCSVLVCVGRMVVGGVGSSGVGSDWTVPVASFPVVFLCLADQHLTECYNV